MIEGLDLHMFPGLGLRDAVDAMVQPVQHWLLVHGSQKA